MPGLEINRAQFKSIVWTSGYLRLHTDLKFTHKWPQRSVMPVHSLHLEPSGILRPSGPSGSSILRIPLSILMGKYPITHVAVCFGRMYKPLGFHAMTKRSPNKSMITCPMHHMLPLIVLIVFQVAYCFLLTSPSASRYLWILYKYVVTSWMYFSLIINVLCLCIAPV